MTLTGYFSRLPAVIQVLVIVLLQIVETVFRSDRNGRVHGPR